MLKLEQSEIPKPNGVLKNVQILSQRHLTWGNLFLSITAVAQQTSDSLLMILPFF